MQYQIRVAGKVFEGTDLKTLLRRAVEAKKSQSPLVALRARHFSRRPAQASSL